MPILGKEGMHIQKTSMMAQVLGFGRPPRHQVQGQRAQGWWTERWRNAYCLEMIIICKIDNGFGVESLLPLLPPQLQALMSYSQGCSKLQICFFLNRPVHSVHACRRQTIPDTKKMARPIAKHLEHGSGNGMTPSALTPPAPTMKWYAISGPLYPMV